MRKAPSPTSRLLRPAPLAVAVAVALAPMSARAMTYTVSSPSPFGTGSLDEAIQQSNANCIADPTPLIQFSIGAGPVVIATGAPFTPIGQGCTGPYNPTIDANTGSQPGSIVNTSASSSNAVFGVTIDGSAVTFSTCGFNFVSSGSLFLRGLEIRGFSAGGSSNAICNTNGDLTIIGNSLHNNNRAINFGGAGNLTVGAPAPADRNYIYANSVYGVYMAGGSFLNLRNNFIGTDQSGMAAAGNGTGVFALNVPYSISGNVIAGNSIHGVQIVQGASGSGIVGNKIGVNLAGTPIPNGIGIRTDNTTLPLGISGNTIRGNGLYGIQVATGNSVQIFNNSIFGNGSKNVTLDVIGGPVPNDFQDVDGGPNNRQNHPLISSVLIGAGPSVTVNYTFNSLPGQNFTLDFYSNSAPGIPAGETFLMSVPVTTDANGDFIGAQMIPGALDNISMAARFNGNGDTSEFSPIVMAVGAPAVNVSSNTMNFGNVGTGTSSASQTVTFTSTGTAPWQISNIGSTFCYGGPICYGGAEFTCMTTCAVGTPYAVNQTCTLSANFNPTFLGPQSTTIQFCDNAVGSPRDIVLSGTGVAPSTFTLTPSAFDFGNVPVGSQSPRAFFSLQNSSASPEPFTTATSGPFSIAGTNCTNPVPAAGSCDFDLVFVPDAPGNATGSFSVSPRSGSPASSSLMGNGSIAPQLSLPSSIDFQFTLGGAPTTQTLTLQNTGLATLDITSIAISGPFTLVNNCPTSLAPGASCTLILGFAAPSSGAFDGTLTIVTNAPGGSRVIALHGLSQPRAVPFLEVTPNEIGFGDQALGTASDGELVKIKNIGGAPAIFDSIVTSPDFVILRHTCIGPLDTGASCEAEVAIRALGYGTRSGKFTVNSNAENSPSQVNIFGTGCRTSGLTLGRLGIARGCRP